MAKRGVRFPFPAPGSSVLRLRPGIAGGGDRIASSARPGTRRVGRLWRNMPAKLKWLSACLVSRGRRFDSVRGLQILRAVHLGLPFCGVPRWAARSPARRPPPAQFAEVAERLCTFLVRRTTSVRFRPSAPGRVSRREAGAWAERRVPPWAQLSSYGGRSVSSQHARLWASRHGRESRRSPQSGAVAQLVEHSAEDRVVAGSTPACTTIPFSERRAAEHSAGIAKWLCTSLIRRHNGGSIPPPGTRPIDCPCGRQDPRERVPPRLRRREPLVGRAPREEQGERRPS